MDFAPLNSAAQPIPLHSYGAIGALAIGAAQFGLPKGTVPHRVMGWLWVTAMAIAAITSFFINEIRLLGPFSFIHILSGLVLVWLVQAIHAARTGKIDAHRRHMRNLYFFALILAGALTLLPGRTMHDVIF